MLEYIALPAGHCRKAFLENYLSGGSAAISCNKCDLCTQAYSVPWNDRIIEANLSQSTRPQQDQRVEAALTMLEALRDHAGMGQRTFLKMLLGEAFGQRRDGTSYHLPPPARNSEYFGALRKYGMKEAQVQELLQQLLVRGYGALEARSLHQKTDGAAGEETSYQALVLTVGGRDVLAGEDNLNLA
jgi:hypothetical protein